MGNMANINKLVTAVLCGALIAGCGAFEVKRDVKEKTEKMKKGPETRPHQTITSFSEGLRCMDDQMIFYGMRDISALVEDLVDHTKKVNAGTKDMLISAVSTMTKRSRAVRLVAFGNDSGNLNTFIATAESKGAFSVVPQFDIRGSISQLDESLVQKQAEGAVNIGIADVGLSGGYAKTATSAVLGLDLTMISSTNYSVIPGVTSRNSVVIYKEGRGVDGEAEYRKFGISYGQTLTRSEGQAQALRTLVELATIELFGKLTKTPYWKCLGADSKNEAIKIEIGDWYYSMSNHGEMVWYLQLQLRQRGYYDGPIDGEANSAYSAAVAQARADLSLSNEDKADLEFFTAFLDSTQRSSVPPFTAQSKEPGPQASKEALALQLVAAGSTGKFKPGDLINLVITPNRDAHVYCYMQDETKSILRFYPNRFSKDSLVQVAAPLQLPGSMRFQLVANEKSVKETVACFATQRDVLSELPAAVVGTDFENLSVSSLQQVRDAFTGVSAGTLGEGYFNVEFN